MKNLSKLFFATVFIFAGAASLHAQISSTPSGFSNPNSATYSSQGSYQPSTSQGSYQPSTTQGSYQPSTSQWGQNQANSSPWTNQNQVNNPNQTTNPNQPFSNSNNNSRLNSFNDSQDNKFGKGWTDDTMAQKIRWAIRDNKNLSLLAKSAEVSVKNNNVTLTGTVASEDEKNKVAAIAREIPGVKSISNNLTVSGR